MRQLVTDLEQVKQLAEIHQDDFEVLGYLLELSEDIPDHKIDAWVDQLADPIIDAIDCTQCANCCRSLDVYLTRHDVQRLADGIDVPLDHIMMNVDHESAQKVKEWGKFKVKPCAFLKGKLCTVYTHRPETCRTYPVFTPDFRWTIADTIEGASICPIIYNVLMTIHERINEIYEL